MAKNRKNQSGAVRFVPALKAVLLCSIIGFFCVGYVWQKNKIYELGQQIGLRQVKLEPSAQGHAGTTNGKSVARCSAATDGCSPEGTAMPATRDSIASGALSASVRPFRAANP